MENRQKGYYWVSLINADWEILYWGGKAGWEHQVDFTDAKLDRINEKRLLSPDEYECEVCHGIFMKDRTEEEAAQEFEQEYKRSPVPGFVSVVCDDCFKKVREYNEGLKS